MIIHLDQPYPIDHEFDYVRNAVVAIRKYANDHSLTKYDKQSIVLTIHVNHSDVRHILTTNVDTISWLTKIPNIEIIG